MKIMMLGLGLVAVMVAAPVARTAAAGMQSETEKVEKTTKKTTKKAVTETKEGLSKTGEVITDVWITGRVHSGFIGQDTLKDSDISVDTKDHVVTLKGTVKTPAGRAKAATIAKNVEGVHRVVNRLTVGPKKG
jgi:hyperosmotically inducible protein